MELNNLIPFQIAAKDINNMFVNSFAEIMESVNNSIDQLDPERDWESMNQITLYMKGISQMFCGFMIGYKNAKMNTSFKKAIEDAKNLMQIVNARINELEDELSNSIKY